MSYLIDRAEEAQKRKLDFAREQADRAAVASGNVDENSALYRHAKLSGWNMGDGPQHGKAGRKWEAAALADQGRMMDARADMMEAATRRSPISIFSSSDAPATPQQHMFAQMGDLIQRGNAARQKKRNMDDAALASALVYAKRNNGFVPPDMLQAMSAQLGRDIAGGNYTSDGNFVLYGRENFQSTNGKVRGEQFVPIAMASPDMQMSVLQRSGIGQDLQKSLWDAMTAPGKLTPQQVMERGHKNPYADDLAEREAAKSRELELKYGKKPLSFGEFLKNVTSNENLMRSITGMDADGNIAQGVSDDPGAANVNADPATLVMQRLRKAYDEFTKDATPQGGAGDPWAQMAQSQTQQPQPRQPGNAAAQVPQDEMLPNGQMRHNGKLYEKAGEKNGVVQWRPVGNAPEAQKGKEQPATQTSASRQPTYDTELTPDEESQYQAWRAKLPKPLQYDGDYDLRGYWKDPKTQKEGIEDGQHFTDKYKKPNHPTFSNESKYAIGDNARIAGRWDGDKFVPSEAQLSNAEKRRVSEFQKLGGEYKQDDDGSVHARISNWEYLPDDLKERYSWELDDLDDIAVDIQRKANEAKRRFDDDFKSSVLPEIKDEAKKAHPNNAELRLRYIERKTNEWRALHDPAEMRNESVRKELNMATRLR